jgi:hypothetical protein
LVCGAAGRSACGAAGLSACGAGAGGVGQDGDCALATVARIVARAALPMARLKVFVVSFICFACGAMLKRAHTKEHFNMLGYSAALLEPMGLLHALAELRPSSRDKQTARLIDPRSSNPLSSTRKSAQTEVTSQGQK